MITAYWLTSFRNAGHKVCPTNIIFVLVSWTTRNTIRFSPSNECLLKGTATISQRCANCQSQNEIIVSMTPNHTQPTRRVRKITLLWLGVAWVIVVPVLEKEQSDCWNQFISMHRTILSNPDEFHLIFLFTERQVSSAETTTTIFIILPSTTGRSVIVHLHHRTTAMPGLFDGFVAKFQHNLLVFW